jgi:hypothetical protein
MLETWLRLLAIFLAAVGLLLLLQSTRLGLAAADALLRAAGGMDQDRYLAILAASAEMYRVLGAVLLGVGLFRVLQGERGRAT